MKRQLTTKRKEGATSRSAGPELKIQKSHNKLDAPHKVENAYKPKVCKPGEISSDPFFIYSRDDRQFQSVLEAELGRLKKILQLGYELKVSWEPNLNSKLSGEVRGDCIYVYDQDEKDAFETLRHEFCDYAVSKVIEPYKDVTNRLITMINEDAYKKKEKLVDMLTDLI